MKDKFKGIIIGIIIGVMLVPTVYATVATITKEIYYNDILITLNGDEVKPTDANGEYVEPFIMDGTTYLPVRGIANALGMDVEWDDDTKTVKLTDETEEKIKVNVGDVVMDERDVKVTFTSAEEKSENLIVCDLLIENSSWYNNVQFHVDDVGESNFVRLMVEAGTEVIKPEKEATMSLIFEKLPQFHEITTEGKSIEINLEYGIKSDSGSGVGFGDKRVVLGIE